MSNQRWELKPHQKFIKFITNPYLRLAPILYLFHITGSGKTISAIQAAEQYIDYLKLNPKINGKVWIIGSYTSQIEFKNQLRGKSVLIAKNIMSHKQNMYTNNIKINELTNQYKKKMIDKNTYSLQYSKIFDSVLKDAGYNFMTYQMLTSNIKNFNNSLVIIDEAHSLLNENTYSIGLDKILSNSKNYRLILLSATPMVNDPQSIVNFINLMPCDKKKLVVSDIFDDSNNISISGKKIIINRTKGKISYFAFRDPKYYPMQINIGKIIPNLLKYTKVIRCEMSKIQYNAYINMYIGKMHHSIKNILNFVIPGNNNEYIFNNIEDWIISKADQQWKKKMGLVIINVKGDIPLISGTFLKLKNLKKWSPKYYKCIMNIINNPDGLHLVYSRFVYNTGARLIGEILRQNGFIEWNMNNISNIKTTSRSYNTHQISKDNTYPSKYKVIHNKMSHRERKMLIKIFNSPENSNGKLIKIIIGSSLIKESIDFKRLSHIHVLGYLENFAQLIQVIGRGMRYDINRNNFLYVYKYVSSIPGLKKFSAEELEYQIDEKNFIVIKKIERILKQNSIDCMLNYDKSPTENYSMKCDYMKCDYKCIGDINIRDIYNKSFTRNEKQHIYQLFYHQYEFFEINNIVQFIFWNNIIFNFDQILELLSKYDINIVLYVIRDMINSKTELTNKFGRNGYLITDGNNLIFHPIEYDDTIDKLTIPYNLRGPGHRKSNIYITDVTKIINNITSYDESTKSAESISEKIEHAILNQSSNKSIEILYKYRFFLIDKNILEETHNVMYNMFHIVPIKNAQIIGHSYDEIPKILNMKLKKFEYNVDLITPSIKLIDSDYIIGTILKSNHSIYGVSIKLKYTQNISQLSDKRLINRGFKCENINKKKTLLNIMKKLSKYTTTKHKIQQHKLYIHNICYNIMIILKNIQYEYIIKNKYVRWIYEIQM